MKKLELKLFIVIFAMASSLGLHSMMTSKRVEQDPYIKRIYRKKAAMKAKKAERIKREQSTIKLTQPLRKKRKQKLIEQPVLTEAEEYQKRLDNNFSDCSLPKLSFLSLKEFFHLKGDATPAEVTQKYNEFIENNSPEILAKRIEAGDLSQKRYDEKQLEIPKIKSVYIRYAIHNGIFKNAESNKTKILPYKKPYVE